MKIGISISFEIQIFVRLSQVQDAKREKWVVSLSKELNIFSAVLCLDSFNMNKMFQHFQVEILHFVVLNTIKLFCFVIVTREIVFD